MGKRERRKHRFGLHRCLQFRRAARKAVRNRGIRLGIAVAEVAERFLTVKCDHPRISDRLA